MAEGFTAENWKLRLFRHPCEDSFSINPDSSIFAVADGVTRDPCKTLPDIKTLMGKAEFAMRYPNPSPARAAADIFTKFLPQFIGDYQRGNRDEEVVRAGFIEANSRIGDYNSQNFPKIDYVVNDLAGCVASASILTDDCIHFGYICDCGVALFDKEGNLKFRTNDEGPSVHDEFIWQHPSIAGKTWTNPEARRIIRRHFRNNPSEPHSFGVLTGEESALSYVKTGSLEFRPGDSLITYSDGLEPVIFSGDFMDKLKERDLKGIKALCQRNVPSEGTLIYNFLKD